MGLSGSGLTGTVEAAAYQLHPAKWFQGEPTTYRVKTQYSPMDEDDYAGTAARRDPLGFYNAMTVKHGGETYVMVGPEVRFVPAAEASELPLMQQIGTSQLSLF